MLLTGRPTYYLGDSKKRSCVQCTGHKQQKVLTEDASAVMAPVSEPQSPNLLPWRSSILTLASLHELPSSMVLFCALGDLGSRTRFHWLLRARSVLQCALCSFKILVPIRRSFRSRAPASTASASPPFLPVQTTFCGRRQQQ